MLTRAELLAVIVRVTNVVFSRSNTVSQNARLAMVGLPMGMRLDSTVLAQQVVSTGLISHCAKILWHIEALEQTVGVLASIGSEPVRPGYLLTNAELTFCPGS